MIGLQDIRTAARAALSEYAKEAPEDVTTGDGGLFLVDVIVHGDEVEVFIDNDGITPDGRSRGVTVEDCIKLTRAIESRFDRDEDDFSLTVSSAGIGQPLKVARQYRKLAGRSVEVVLTSGTKMIATLEDVATGPEGGIESLTLSYPEKHKAEGKKRPEIVTVTKTFVPTDIKTVKEHIDFK